MLSTMARDNEIPVFRINMDNTPLLNEIKQRRFDDQAARNQFMYGNVLVGLSLLLQDKEKGEQPARCARSQSGGPHRLDMPRARAVYALANDACVRKICPKARKSTV